MSSKIKEAIHVTARYYGRTVEDDVLLMMAGDLADLPESQVIDAYHAYRRNPKNKTMPYPAQIREIIEPVVDVDSAAREIAARINHAIVKFGWCNAKYAEGYIGSVGWSIVERSGGWNYICENHGVVLDPGVFSAQVREIAKSQLKNESESIAKMIGLNQQEKTKLIENDKKLSGIVNMVLNKLN